MSRDQWMWTLVAFFGGTVAFGGIRRATEDGPVLVTIGLEVAAFALIVGLIVLIVRRSGR